MSLLPISPSDTPELVRSFRLTGSARIRRRTFEILERAGPGDRQSLLVDGVLMALISLSVVAIILESIDSLYEVYADAFFWFEVFTVAVFSVEYVLRIWAVVEGATRTVQGHAAMVIRIKSMLSAPALIDLLAILPFYLMMTGLIGPADMRFLRILRLLRVFKLTRYSAAFETLNQAFRENARSFAAAFFILIVVMLLAATGMYYFEEAAQPEAFSSIPAAMWWAFVTLTTVGYGDVTPITVGGKVFGAMITVVGVGMVALPAGILASAFTEQLRVRSMTYHRKVDEAYEDGEVTEAEAQELERLREDLGLDPVTAERILSAEATFVSNPSSGAGSHCPHCGSVTRS
jgi:voltage-gated potassium channel